MKCATECDALRAAHTELGRARKATSKLEGAVGNRMGTNWVIVVDALLCCATLLAGGESDRICAFRHWQDAGKISSTELPSAPWGVHVACSLWNSTCSQTSFSKSIAILAKRQPKETPTNFPTFPTRGTHNVSHHVFRTVLKGTIQKHKVLQIHWRALVINQGGLVGFEVG